MEGPLSSARNKYDLDFTELHDRALNFDTRAGDRILSRIRKRGESGRFTDMRVWDTSERAIELVYPENEDHAWAKGDSVDLEVTVGSQRILFEGLIVDEIRHNEFAKRIGIRYARRLEKWSRAERRSGPRWICSNQYYPICVATSPFISSGAVVFQVSDVSSEGMQLVCDISKTYLIPQLKIRLTVNFPLVGDFVTTVEVVRIGFDSVGGKDHLSIGVKFLKLTHEMRSVIAQYLIEFSNAPSLRALRDHGFKPPDPKRGVDFYFAKTESEIRAIWKLRRLAHENDDNIAITAVTDEEMSDKYDMVSRLIVGSYRGKIIATARTHFGSMDLPLEHENYVEWPQSLPRRDQVFEVSRVALDPEFQKGDLLFGLFQFIVMTYREERPYVVLSAWPHQVGLYEKLGFSDTGLRHKGDLWKHEQRVMIADGLASLCGRNLNPVTWNLTWRPVAERMIDCGVIEPKGMNKLRMEVYKAFGLPSRFVERIVTRPRKA